MAFVDENYTRAQAENLKNSVLTVNNVESVEFVTRQVGATNAFIRMPFIIEGLILGLLGGGLGFLCVWGLYEAVCANLLSGFIGSMISILPFASIMWPMLIVFLGVGVLIGVFGGSIAIRNYLKV